MIWPCESRSCEWFNEHRRGFIDLFTSFFFAYISVQDNIIIESSRGSNLSNLWDWASRHSTGLYLLIWPGTRAWKRLCGGDCAMCSRGRWISTGPQRDACLTLPLKRHLLFQCRMYTILFLAYEPEMPQISILAKFLFLRSSSCIQNCLS